MDQIQEPEVQIKWDERAAGWMRVVLFHIAGPVSSLCVIDILGDCREGPMIFSDVHTIICWRNLRSEALQKRTIGCSLWFPCRKLQVPFGEQCSFLSVEEVHHCCTLIWEVMLLAHVRSSAMCTPRNLVPFAASTVQLLIPSRGCAIPDFLKS